MQKNLDKSDRCKWLIRHDSVTIAPVVDTGEER